MKLYFNKLIFMLIIGILPMMSTANQKTLNDSNYFRIDQNNGLYNVDSKNSPLFEMLDELRQISGVKTSYLIDAQLLPKISIQLESKSIDEVITALLSGLNTMVVYKKSLPKIPLHIWILGMDKASSNIDIVDNTAFKKLNDKQRSEMLLLFVAQKVASDDELINALSHSLTNDHSALVRTRAAIGLAQFASERSIKVLQSALIDPSQSVRNQVILALGMIQSDSATEILGNILTQGSQSFERVLAVRSLKLQSSELASYYLDLAKSDVDAQVRKLANSSGKADSIQSIKNKEGIEF